MSPAAMRRLAKPMLLAATVIWGASFVFTKNALDALPWSYLVAIRFTVGTPLLMLAAGRKWKHFTPDYLWRGGIAGLLLYLTYWGQTVGLTMTTPSKNAFLTAVYCVLVPFFAWAVTRRRPDRYNVSAAVLCVAGIGLVSLSERLTINAGDLLTLVGAVFCAANLVAVSHLGQGKDVMLLTVVQFACTALCCWLTGLCTASFPVQALTRPEVFWPLAYLCILATAVGLMLQNIGIVWCEPAAAAVLLSLESVFGVLFSVILYGDPITPRLLTGFVFIFTAVVCSETKFSFLRKKFQKALPK